MSISKASSSAVAPGAKGDLVVGTTTNDSGILAVGANGTVLTANSATATGLSWAAPSAGALTLIRRASFTSVANTGTTFDSVFTTIYRQYLVIVENISAASSADDIQLQFRNNSTTISADYFGVQFGYGLSGTSPTLRTIATSAATQLTITNESSSGTSLSFYVSGVGGSTSTASVFGNGIDRGSPVAISFAGGYYDTANINGIIFKSSSSSITGTVAIYGLGI